MDVGARELLFGRERIQIVLYNKYCAYFGENRAGKIAHGYGIAICISDGDVEYYHGVFR